MTYILRILAALGLVALLSGAVQAQSRDVSPVLLIESGPSDNPDYRRMVFVKYLSGDQVRVNYRAYNRTEFTQVPNTTPATTIRNCATGAASTLDDIRAFERSEAQRERAGQSPTVSYFCIKNVPNWEGGNKKTWLDPIFNGLPYAASLNR